MPRMPLKITLTYDGEMFLAASSAAGIESAKPMLEPISAISSVSISDQSTLSHTVRSNSSNSPGMTAELSASPMIDSGLNPRCAELPIIIKTMAMPVYWNLLGFIEPPNGILRDLFCRDVLFHSSVYHD